MRRVVILAAVAALLLAGLDVGARRFAEARIEESARARLRGVAGVDADIDSVPFLGRLALDGSVSAVSLELDTVEAGPLRLSGVVLRLERVRIDRGELFGERRVEVRSIERGSLRADLTEDALASLAPIEVRVSAAGVEARTPTGVARIRTEIRGDTLVLVPDGRPEVAITLPADLFGCGPRVDAVPGRLRLSCELTRIPSRLRAALTTR